MIPQKAIEEVKARNDIVDVVSSYVQLGKRSGRNIFGLCPFHREKTPSFSVSETKQMYYCFGCHKGGDVIGFIMEMEKLSYVEAIRKLAERVGYELPEDDDPRERAREQARKKLYDLNTEAARYFYHQLQSDAGRPAREYLARRKLGIPIQRQFGIGYAPDRWQGLWDHLMHKGYDVETLSRSGLFKQNRHGGYYDLFRGRVIFPIIDVLGRIIAFGGRVLDDSEPKYLNSPETAIYTKGRHLFGLNIAKKSRADELLLVEGYMDVISLHQAGFDQAVAVLGTALTPAQAQLMTRYQEKIVLALDSDRAGQQATIKALDILNAKHAEASVLVMPGAKDPDVYIKEKGAESFRNLIRESLSRLDYLLALASERATDGKGERDPIRYQEEAIDVLRKIDNTVVLELYIARVAEELRISPDAVRLEMERRSREGGGHVDPYQDPVYRQLPVHDPGRDNEGRETPDDDTPQEVHLSKDQFYYLMLFGMTPELQPAFLDRFQTSWIKDPVTTSFVETLLEHAKDETLTSTELLRISRDYRMDGESLSDRVAAFQMRSPADMSLARREEAMNELIADMELDALKAYRQTLARKISEARSDDPKLAEHRRAFEEVSRKLAALRTAAQER